MTPDNCIVAVSLGKFVPSRLDGQVICTEMDRWLRERGIHRAAVVTRKGVLPIGVRMPEEHIRLSADNVIITNWHKDGLGDYKRFQGNDTRIPSIRWLIMWSNGTATEVRDEDGVTLKFEPYDVILVDNRRVQHRAPHSEENRWFARLADPIIDTAVVR